MTGPAIDRAAVLAAARPELEAFPAEARALVRRFKRLMAIGLVFPVAGAAAGVLAGSYGFGLGASIGVLAMAVFWLVFGLRAFSRISGARAATMKAAAPALGLSYASRPAEPIDLSAFEGTYYGSIFEHARAEDVMAGARGGGAFEIFDVKLRARSKGPDGEWSASEPPPWLKHVVFAQSRVVRVSIPGRWTARTVILRDEGLANRFSAPDGAERVRLVDPEFERMFEVYSDDQVEARALLDPAFMERLKRLEDIFAAKPKAGDDNAPPPAVAVFSDGRFLLAMPIARPGRSARRPDRLAEEAEITLDLLIDEIDAVMGVVDALTGEAGR